MNFKQTIKQSWQIIKQNKLYSFFYILGTALAISMVMVIAIGYNLKVGSVYPEVNRGRTLVLKDILIKKVIPGGSSSSSSEGVSYDFIKKLTLDVEEIEAVCIRYCWSQTFVVQKNTSSASKKKEVSFSNEEIWNVLQFDFIDGRPFTKEEVDNSSRLAVISASTAKSVFGNEPAIDKKILIHNQEYTICGIVEDVSPLVHTSYADIFLPLEPPGDNVKDLYGVYSALILAKSSKDFDRIKTHMKDNLAKVNNTLDEGVEVNIYGGPYSFVEENLAMNTKEGKTDASSKHILQLIIIILVIIMVPTFNISGIISTEMGEREAEMGVRKAFGAPRWKLLYSLTNENILLSFIGGIFGILLSYLFIFIGYQLFLSFFVINESTLPWLNMEMLINYKVILIAFISCLLMNLLSSIIPQYFSTKKNIVVLLKRNNNVRGGKAKRGKHIWIFMELLAVFVIAWMIIDPLYVLNYQKSIYDGFKYDDLYTANIPLSDKQKTEEDTYKYTKIILDIIKNHPFVENAVIGRDLPIAASSSSSGSISRDDKDSLSIDVNILHIPADKNYFSVQGIKIPEKLDEANFHEGSILISKFIADKFFKEDEAVGKSTTHGRVIGVVDDIKTMKYKQPIPTVIRIRHAHTSTFQGVFLVKAKPGISKKVFIKTLTEDLSDKFSIGNRSEEQIYPYSEQIEKSNSQITQEKKIYTLLACFVLFNMFLGIFATFWLQSKKRRGEIGLRMAMGSSKKKVSRMFVMESVKMASLAALVGMIVVANIVYFKGMFTYGEFQNPVYWAVTNDTAHFIIVSLIAYAVILLTVTLGTLIPASKAANTNPVDALRDE